MAEWKPAPGFEGIYEVSHMGEVRRIAPASGTSENRVLSPRNNSASQYAQVYLSKNRQIHMRYVHLLVAEAFHGKRPGVNYRADHLNNDRTDNRASNLRWITASENTRKGMRRKRRLAR